MSGPMTYSAISALTQTIWEAAMEIARARNVMPALVQSYSGQGMVARTSSEWGDGTTFAQVAETDDIGPTTISRAQTQTLTPYEYGDRHDLTDQRLETDPENARAYAAENLGIKAAETIEKHLLSDIASLTGGTVGAAGTVITWGHIYAARAQMQAANLYGPYNVVLHTYQMFQLQRQISNAGITLATLPQPGGLNAPFGLFQVGDMTFYPTNNLTINGSDDATGAMFMRDALAIDFRRAFRLEPQRDASARTWELVASMVYAHGIWRPTRGWKLLFDATAPTS